MKRSRMMSAVPAKVDLPDLSTSSLPDAHTSTHQNAQFTHPSIGLLDHFRRMQLLAVVGAPPGLDNSSLALAQSNSNLGRDYSGCLSASSLSDASTVSAGPPGSFSKPPGSFSNSQQESSTSSSASANRDTSNITPAVQKHCPNVAGGPPGNFSGHQTDVACHSTYTTVIVRNVSDDCTRQMFIDFLEQTNFKESYNLFYLPLHFITKKTFKYAFIDFASHHVAIQFRELVQGCTDTNIFGEGAADISWSECQGLQANIAMYRNSSVMHPSVAEEFKPLLLEGGNILPFPKPTKKIKEAPKPTKKVKKVAGVTFAR